MKITARHDLPGYNTDAIPRAGVVLDVYLDGVLQRLVETVDTERGFIDVMGPVVTYPFPRRLVHRLFGNVTVEWSQRPSA